MAKGINKVILIGNLGKDPEANSAATRITIATSEAIKDKQSGEYTDRTEWHRVVLFGRLGEIAMQYLKKGSKVYIEGRLQTSSYEKNGETRYSVDIIAGSLQMLDSKGNDGMKAETPSNYTPRKPVATLYDDSAIEDDLPF